MNNTHDSGLHALPTADERAEIESMYERANRPGPAKCEPLNVPLRMSQIHAKRAYKWCVDQLGGNSDAARAEEITEGAVRLRLEHPRKHPPLSAAFDMPPRLMRYVARLLLEVADEKERSARRAV